MKLVLIALSLWFSGALAASAETVGDIAKQVFRSTVLLVMEDKNGQPLSHGSGFFIGPNIIVTNFHVIEGASSGYVKLVGRKEVLEVAGAIAVNSKNDIALLKIKGPSNSPLALGDDGDIAVGDAVYAVGNPLGLEGTFSNGIVSGIRRFGPDVFIQMTAPISPGSSGGPVVNAKGLVIGVATSTFTEGQNLNFAIPISYVRTALLNPEELKSLGSIQPRNTRESKNPLGGKSLDAIKITHVNESDNYFNNIDYSVTNISRRPVKAIRILWIFKDDNDNPVDFKIVVHESIIPARLAKRERLAVNPSSFKIASGRTRSFNRERNQFKFNYEARVLDFQFAE